MTKLFAFIVTFPLAFILFVKAVAFYDFDTKQRYLQNSADLLAYKAQITGVVTSSEMTEFQSKASSLLNDASVSVAYSVGIDPAGNGNITWSTYSPGTQMTKGQYFKIYVVGGQSLYSKAQVGKSSPDKVHYKAKSVVRVEKL